MELIDFHFLKKKKNCFSQSEGIKNSQKNCDQLYHNSNGCFENRLFLNPLIYLDMVTGYIGNLPFQE